MQYASLLTSEWGAFVALLSRIIDLDKTAWLFLDSGVVIFAWKTNG
jgi:hypothetical protein